MMTFTFNSPAPLTLNPTFWIDGAAISRNLPGRYNTHGNGIPADTPTDAYVTAHAAVAADAKARGDLIYFDGEIVPADALPVCIAAVDSVAPGIRKTVYSAFPGPGTREVAIALAYTGATTDATRAMDAWARTDGRAIHADLDYVDCGAYLLGPAFVDRDLKYIAAITKLARKYLPDKRVIFSVWGVYHPTWNQPDAVVTGDVLKKYVAAVRRFGDAAVVFGATEGRDDQLVSMLTA